MRDDIAKKLCERPRYGGGGKYNLKAARRAGKNPNNWNDLPKKESMRRVNIKNWNAKYLNEYFPPLLGFLKKNVGRPWNKVFSEICQNLNPSSTVHKHVFDHLLRDFVETKPIWKDGSNIPYNEYGSEISWYYVDRHGFLRDNSVKRKRRSNKERAKRRRQRDLEARRRVPIHSKKEYRYWRGAWFIVEYVHIGKGESAYDVMFREEMAYGRWGNSSLDREHGYPMHGKERIFDKCRVAVSKRQLSKREIRRQGLNKL